jgi:site-specific recombinase XerD
LHLADARDSWLRALAQEGASPRTQETYSESVDQFIRFQRDHHRPTDVAKVARADVEAFITHLQDTRSRGTAHNRYRALRALFNYCSEDPEGRTRREPLGIIERSPMRRMAAPKLDDVPIPLLSPEQVQGLWQATERPGKDFARRRDAAVVRLFLATGIRASEMTGLTLDDLDLRAQMLTVAGKGRKWRPVPYSAAAAVALDRYLAVRDGHRWAHRTDRVWLGPKGPLTRSGVQGVVEKVGLRAGVPNLRPHRLRHVAVDALFSAGMSETDVESLMGWTSSAMSRRYASARRTARALKQYRALGIADPYR